MYSRIDVVVDKFESEQFKEAGCQVFAWGYVDYNDVNDEGNQIEGFYDERWYDERTALINALSMAFLVIKNKETNNVTILLNGDEILIVNADD